MKGHHVQHVPPQPGRTRPRSRRRLLPRAVRAAARQAETGDAKFELTDPPVALALQQADRAALSHLGIRVGTTDEVDGASTRLRQSGLVTLDERDTACCHARQDKVWVADPAGNRWEVYTVLGDIEHHEDREHGAEP